MHKRKLCLAHAKAVFQLLGTESSARREQQVAFTRREKSQTYSVPLRLVRGVSHHAGTFLLRAALCVKLWTVVPLVDFFGWGCPAKLH